MARRTKILATLGPASEDADTIRSMVDAGLDAARLNFSHGEPEDHRQLADRVRRAADEVARPVSLVRICKAPRSACARSPRAPDCRRARRSTCWPPKR
jgi:pyruvate kinase